MTVLVVEDETPLLRAIKIKLEANGFNVLTAKTVKQAIDYLDEVGGVDAVWLDHYLIGKETGLDLAAYLKKHKKYKTLPIFVVSNTASPEKIDAYFKIPVAKYYIKANSRLSEIIQDIKNILGTNK